MSAIRRTRCLARLPTHLETARLSGVRLLISNQHAGLVAAMGRAFQGVGHQRCRVHFARNLLALVPKSHKDMVAAVFRTIFAQPDPGTVAATWDSVRDQLAAAFPRIGPLMDEAEAEVLAFTTATTGEDLVDKSAGEGQQGDQTPRPGGGDLPQRASGDPTRRRRPGRHARRVANLRPPLPLRRLHGQDQHDR